MEQKEKIENPEWVNVVEKLPEIVRQAIGNQCANVIASLVNLFMISSELYDSVRNEAEFMVTDYCRSIEESVKRSADSFVDELVNDAQDGKLQS